MKTSGVRGFGMSERVFGKSIHRLQYESIGMLEVVNIGRFDGSVVPCHFDRMNRISMSELGI